MQIVDGSEIDVEDMDWLDSLESLGITDCDMIAVRHRNGEEYAFKPSNGSQRILYMLIFENIWQEDIINE